MGLGFLEKKAEAYQRKMMRLLIAYLGFFAGTIFLVLGVCYLFIDLAGLPRGGAFILGGLFLILSSLFVILNKI